MMRLGLTKLVNVLLAVSVLVPYLMMTAAADGVIINPWGVPFEEGAQTAVILWEKGMETLALHVSSKAPDGSFWLVPIPNKPDMIVVSHVRSLTFSGYDRGIEAWKAAKSRAAGWYAGMGLISQLYPIISPCSWGLLYKLWIRTPPIYVPLLGEVSSVWRSDEGVSIHEVIESYGLTSYVVTADNADSFYQFFLRIGAKVPEEVKGVLKDYIGKGFSFVVSRVQPVTITRTPLPNSTKSEGGEYLEQAFPIQPSGLGVVITFPTERPFYPLVPTSVYGSKVIPVRLYVKGLWEAQDLGQPLSGFIKVEHFVEAHLGLYTYPVIEPLSGTEMSEYTLVTMDSPSKYLKSDLMLLQASAVELSVNFSWTIGLVLFLACSAVASAVASVLLGRRSGNDVAKAGLIGLSNLLTLVGYYWIASRALGKERHSTSNWKALVISTLMVSVLLVAGVSIIGVWLIMPHYYWWSVTFTPIISLVALLPAVAVAWIYWKLNASLIALGTSPTVVPINGKALKQSLVFSFVFVILFAFVTHALILFG